jgi:hypothetical protein
MYARRNVRLARFFERVRRSRPIRVNRSLKDWNAVDRVDQIGRSNCMSRSVRNERLSNRNDRFLKRPVSLAFFFTYVFYE